MGRLSSSPAGSGLRVLEAVVALEGVPALLEADEVGGAHPGPVLVPQQAPHRVVEHELLDVAGGRRPLVAIGLVHVLVDQLVHRGVRVRAQVRELRFRVEQERQVIEGIVDPRLPRLDRELVVPLGGELPEGGVRLLDDVHLEADLLQLALQPHRGLLVRGPAHPDGQVHRNRRPVHPRLLHQRLGLGDYSPYKHDIAKARALMKEAGMDRAPIPVDLAIRVGWPTHEQASVWLQRELEQIGFKVNIVKETDATFRQLATKGDHQLSIEAWQSWINDPFYHLTFLFNSKSKFTNLSAYSNPAVDKLIDENMHQTNRDKRAAASRDIQKLVLDDAVWGLLWYENWTRVGTADLVGLEKRWDTFERYYSLKRT